MKLSIGGDVSVTTGSSGGLGLASARALAREGSHVVINGRNEDSLESAAESIRSSVDTDVEVLPIAGDLTEKSDVQHLIERSIDEFGTIDHLVTSVGGPPSGTFFEITDEDWYNSFDQLVMSAVWTIREAAPALQSDGGGTIVNITSRSVKEAIDGLLLSNSVRMSVIGLEKTLSRELAPDVRVNAVLPGPHETERVENLIKASVERGEFESYEDGLHAKGQSNPLGRIGEPIELGNTVAFLSAPESGYINGTAIPIDGGAGNSNL